MTSNATATHRVFDALQGLYPVTFDNVIEADPEGLLDIFEGVENTRNLYFNEVMSDINFMGEKRQKIAAGMLWSVTLKGYFDGHDSDCDGGPQWEKDECVCRERHRNNSQQWGQELYEAIEQRIRELND